MSVVGEGRFLVFFKILEKCVVGVRCVDTTRKVKRVRQGRGKKNLEIGTNPIFYSVRKYSSLVG